MTHLINVVRNWGPLWVHDAFTFESWNRKIMDFVTSSYAGTHQVAERFLLQRFLINTLYDEKISPETKKFIAKQVKMPIEESNTYERNCIVGLGKSVSRPPTDNESATLNKIGFNPMHLQCFKKMKLNGVRYSSENGKKLKFCNSIIYDGNKTFGTIVIIVKFQCNNV